MEHLLDIESLAPAQIEEYLHRARIMKSALMTGQWDKKRLEGRVLITMFLENSTRTRTSFEMAAYRLGASLIHWDSKTSSLSKGESLSDTLKCIASYKPDGVILRSSEYKAPYTFKTLLPCPVINAGDSYRAHPTQALLDAFTILEAKNGIEGLKIAICGDISHSRVASCNIQLLGKLGAEIRLIAPPALLPQKTPFSNIQTFSSMEEGLMHCDVIMMLRIQKERMDASAIPDDSWYFRKYGLTSERLKLARPDVMVLHPAPMNRNVEIADEVADDPEHSFIFKQMENGLPVRMAVLDKLIT